MQSIDDLLHQMESHLEKLNEPGKGLLSTLGKYIISSKAVSQIVSACFYASTISDEERWPKAILVPSCGMASDRLIARFTTAIAFEPIAIAKLAHATSDWCRLAFVVQDDEPRIVGIAPSMAILMGRFTTQGGPRRKIGGFHVSITGPGNLDVLCHRQIFTYQSGTITKFRLLLESVATQSVGQTLNKRIDSLLGEEYRSKRKLQIADRLKNIQNENIVDLLEPALENEVAGDSDAQLVICELINQIYLLGHGGILIITEKTETERLTYRYKSESLKLQHAVIRYWETASEDGYGTSRKGFAGAAGTELIHEGLMLREVIEATAHLANTDGALVLGTDLRLAGFGAIIDKTNIEPSSFKFVDSEDNSIEFVSLLQNRGSRHQSALSFAMSEENAFVAVISQDGTVTVFQNEGKTIRVEKGLRAGIH